MTVKELIEKLKECPQDANVYHNDFLGSLMAVNNISILSHNIGDTPAVVVGKGILPVVITK
jgi:hypothetical protein